MSNEIVRSPANGPRLAPLHVGKIIPPPYAGIEAHIDTLLRALGNEVASTLVATRGYSAPALDPTRPYRLLPIRSLGKLASVALSPGIPLAAAAEFRSGRCNLLHLHAPNPWGDLSALLVGHEVPVVLTWHSDIVRQKRLMKLYGPLQRRTIERADKVVVFTPKHYESSTQLRQAGIESKLVAIPMGIDFARLDAHLPDAPLIDEVDRWRGDRRMILTVGRHVYYKGFEFLIRAFAAMKSEAVLVMIGTGPLTQALEQQIRALGVADRVKLLGEVGDRTLISMFHHCDLFTLPSIEPSEAFGIATAEAKACGKPVVVCELGNGVNYLTRHGETGLAVPPRDVAALSHALDTLVVDDALRQSMGMAARQWVRNEFSVQRMRDSTLALYGSLL